MNAPTTLSALALAALTPTAAPAQNFDPYNSPPSVWMIELNDHLSEPDYPLWHYTRGTIAGATAMTTLANDAQLVICLPPSTTNADLLAMLGEYLVTFDLIENDTTAPSSSSWHLSLPSTSIPANRDKRSNTGVAASREAFSSTALARHPQRPRYQLPASPISLRGELDPQDDTRPARR